MVLQTNRSLPTPWEIKADLDLSETISIWMYRYVEVMKDGRVKLEFQLPRNRIETLSKFPGQIIDSRQLERKRLCRLSGPQWSADPSRKLVEALEGCGFSPEHTELIVRQTLGHYEVQVARLKAILTAMVGTNYYE